MRPILTGTALITEGRKAGVTVPFKIFHTTPKEALHAFTRSALIDALQVPPGTPAEEVLELSRVFFSLAGCAEPALKHK